jgi:uncharacterized protein (DUF697 family)
MDPNPSETSKIAEHARAFAPVVWLLGKVQSGKTSIIRELTQASDAEIGAGFAACTKSARVFDFPGEAPIIRFLDTRGLGEAGYDPAPDMAFCEERAHLLLGVVKALDLEEDAVLAVMRAVRQRHPDWPVVIAQTCLHEGYAAGMNHAPYGADAASLEAGLPPSLARALAHQRALFAALPGRAQARFVSIDFTQAGDGFEPADYGREALVAALMAAAPAAVAVALAELARGRRSAAGDRANAHILGFALAAGASDAVPVAGLIAVPVVQAAMLRQLARLSGASWNAQAYREFAVALGAGTLVRTASSFGARQLVKLIPVYGQTAGAAAAAAASFAATYAMGKAANYFLLRRREGRRAEAVATVYRDALRQAFTLAKTERIGAREAAP